MQAEQRAQHREPTDVAALLALTRSQQEEIKTLKRQLEWFKKQLFGTKSERRHIDSSPDQLSLGEAVAPADSTSELPARTVAAHARRVAVKPTTDEAGDSGLKFDSTVPLEVVEIDDPRTAELTTEQYDVIGEKATYRLAQRPGSYVVIKYVGRVLKVKETGDVSCPPAPARGQGRRATATRHGTRAQTM